MPLREQPQSGQHQHRVAAQAGDEPPAAQPRQFAARPLLLRKQRSDQRAGSRAGGVDQQVDV